MPQGLAIATVDVSFPLLAPNGSAAAPSYSFASDTDTGLYYAFANAISMSVGGAEGYRFSQANLLIYSSLAITWGNAGMVGANVSLYGDASGVMSQRNGTAAQEFRVYGTTTGSKYITFSHDGASGFVGTTSGGVYFTPASGIVGPGTPGAIDLGATGSRWRSLYLGGNTLVASAPMIDCAQTWNDAGVTFVGVKIAITDTLSGVLSKPLQILGGAGAVTSLMYLTGQGGLVTGGSITAGNPIYAPVGSLGAPSISFTGYTSTGLYYDTGNGFIAAGVAGNIAWLTYGASRFCVAGDFAFSLAQDVLFTRLGAASLRLGGASSATPIAQTFTIGEASRPGTDTNVGGGNATIQSGLGTGTGTESTITFQTPDLAASGSGTQSYATRLTISSGGIVGLLFIATPTGEFQAKDGSNQVISRITSSGMTLGSGGTTLWQSAVDARGGTTDLGLARLAAASLRQGLAPSATPVAQTFTIGEFSRVGTDNNVAGSDGTIRSGSGTGNAAGSSLFFDTPTVGASGTVQQSYGHRLTLSALGATFDIPDQGLRINNQVNGAGASAGTLTNAPSAGNPNFWLPISIAGTVRFCPLW